MNPYLAYQQPSGTAWTRVDLLLLLYDKAIERLRSEQELLREDNVPEALPLLMKAQLALMALAAGVHPGFALATELRSLYAFVGHAIAACDADKIAALLNILDGLRQSFLAIRDEAVALERSGVIPPAASSCVVQALA